ncbi:MAG: hypothetical protein IT208_10570 [Chthonomonadales bacterium]|nr:hypothetical protein [Chthonomonadales bacterium]
MSVTINLPPDVEARIQAEAAKQSLPVEDFIVRLVADAMPPLTKAKQRERSLSLLRSVRDLGDDAEQRETFAYLKTAVNDDRLSARERFA